MAPNQNSLFLIAGPPIVALNSLRLNVGIEDSNWVSADKELLVNSQSTFPWSRLDPEMVNTSTVAPPFLPFWASKSLVRISIVCTISGLGEMEVPPPRDGVLVCAPAISWHSGSRDSWGQSRKAVHVLPGQRCLLEGIFRNDRSCFRGNQINGHLRSGNNDFGGGCSNLQHGRNGSNLSHLEDQVLLIPGLKTGRLNLQGIRGRGYAVNAEIASLTGTGSFCNT